jgi:hypothetical protein
MANKMFLKAEKAFTGTDSKLLSQLFSNVTNEVFDKFNPQYTHTIEQAQKAIYGIGNATFNSTQQRDQVSTLFAVIQDSLFDNFGIDPPEADMSAMAAVDLDPNEEWTKNMGAFMLVVSFLAIP